VQSIHRNDPVPYPIALVADVDGDGKGDVISYQGAHGPHMQAIRWVYVSGGHLGPWATLASRKYVPNRAPAIGRFRDARRVDFLEWKGNQLFAFSAVPNTSEVWNSKEMK
jgi:hypothetical protein